MSGSSLSAAVLDTALDRPASAISCPMTISQRRILRTFIGSPGDLTEERSAARLVVDELNRALRDVDWQIDLLGWEDTLPGRARPQELINDDIRRSNLFIGMLWHRWGSPTGTYTSGFEEEYELARRLSTDHGEPEVWLYLKDVDPERRADPGEQLTQVLAFRDRIQHQREVLYKPFSDVDRFVVLLREALLRYVLGLQAAMKTPEISAPEQPPIDAISGSSGPAASKGQTDQAVMTLRGIADALASGDRIEVWEAARLRLAASTVFSAAYFAEPITAHPANVLYASGRNLVLTDPELYTILRSILTGWDTVPGWRWLSEGGAGSVIDVLASLSVVDNDEGVRVRALKMLSYSRVSLADLEIDGESYAASVLGDRSPSVVSAAIDYLATVVKDSETVEALLPVLGDERNEFQARLLVSLDPARAVAVLLSGSGHLSHSTLCRYERAMRSAEDILLHAALTDRRSSVRMFALRELARRDMLTKGDISKHLADTTTDVRREAARALVAAPATEYREARDAVKQVNPERPWEERVLIRQATAKLPSDTLAERIFFYETDTDEAYAVLGERGDERVIRRLRSDLDEDFEALHAESVARLVEQHGEEVARYIVERSAKVKDFIISERAGAALSVLVQASGPEDVPLARKYLLSPSEPARLASILILEKWGREDDAAALLPLAREAYGDVKEAATAALVSIDSALEGAAAPLLSSNDPVHIRHALGHLTRTDRERAMEASRVLLYSESEAVRRLAFSALLELCDRNALTALVSEYQRASQYFYDVVVWLDTVLYAPTPLSEGFRSAMQADLADPER
jgi:hypothetical protein